MTQRIAKPCPDTSTCSRPQNASTRPGPGSPWRGLTAWLLSLAAGTACCLLTAAERPADLPTHSPPEAVWLAAPRLLRPGESIEFTFRCPPGVTPGSALEIVPRYLERAKPGKAFQAGGDLAWLERLSREKHPLAFAEGRARLVYTPRQPGNYLARWRAGTETLHRYFAVAEEDAVVLRFSTFEGLVADPTLHATGIPLDYRLPIEQFDPADPLFRQFRQHHRLFGENIIAAFPDTPALSHAERLKQQAPQVARARSLMPDPGELRSARIDMRHDLDPGYIETLAALGFNDHCGLWEANAKPWLGMPEFPYFSSPKDCRMALQEPGGSVVSHQWDFCGGWHFVGPVSWHYKAAAGDWAQAQTCIDEGLAELALAARNSGHPAFAVPLYDGLAGPGYPNPRFRYDVKAGEGDKAGGMRAFVDRYQRHIAFEATKRHKLVFTRSIDLADYYRRHYPLTPRTVYACQTDHLFYDSWWQCHWCNDGHIVTRQCLPPETRLAPIFDFRRKHTYFKDPLSTEYLLVEDHRRSIRFERACPNPIWWFDYTRPSPGPQGSALSHVETPEVAVEQSPWTRGKDGRWRARLTLQSPTAFPGYAITLWGLPRAFQGGSAQVRTSAQEAIVARNRAGERHLILLFDLQPETVLEVSLEP